MCDSGRCSSVRRHGVSQNQTMLVETPMWSAIMRAGNNSRVKLKWNSAHSRLECTSRRSAVGVGLGHENLPAFPSPCGEG